MAEELTKLTGVEGKVYELRPLPKHLMLFYGELPSNFTEKAVASLQKGDMETFTREALGSMTAKQIRQAIIISREAVKFAMVKPRLIELGEVARDETELSPLYLPEADFKMISTWALSGGATQGGQAEGLNSFRNRPKQAARNRSNGKKLRKAAK